MGISRCLPKSISLPSRPWRKARNLFSWMSWGGYLRKPRFCDRSFSSLAQMAWIRAARQMTSSTLVTASQIRNSIVGYCQCGRRSHQMLLPVSMVLVLISSST